MNRAKEMIKKLAHFRDDHASSFLLLLLSADFAFIVAYFFHVHTSIFDIYLFSLTIDRSYSEIFQYVKEFWIVLLILAVLVKTKEIGYLSWAIVFTYMLMDDAFFIHEQLGGKIADNLDITSFWGLETQDLGELAAIGVPTVLTIGLVCIFYSRGSTRFRANTRDLLIFLLLFAFFAVFIDVFHASVDLGWRGNFVLDVLEDGGEMITISLATWYVFFLNARKGVATFSLYGLLRESITKEAP
jgi:hypothetical protein